MKTLQQAFTLVVCVAIIAIIAYSCATYVPQESIQATMERVNTARMQVALASSGLHGKYNMTASAYFNGSVYVEMIAANSNTGCVATFEIPIGQGNQTALDAVEYVVRDACWKAVQHKWAGCTYVLWVADEQFVWIEQPGIRNWLATIPAGTPRLIDVRY